MARAETAGLRVLGDADPATMFGGDLAPDARARLDGLTTDPIAWQQYADFLRMQTFRRSLLVHGTADVTPAGELVRLADLYFLAGWRPEAAPAGGDRPGEVRYRHLVAASRTCATTGPLLQAGLAALAETWPAAPSFAALLASVRRRLAPGTLDAGNLRQVLFRAVAGGIVEPALDPPRVLATVSERPLVSALARHQAATRERLTNQHHASVRLDDVARQVIGDMDGRHDPAALGTNLAAALGLPPAEAARRTTPILDQCARAAPLVAPLAGAGAAPA